MEIFFSPNYVHYFLTVYPSLFVISLEYICEIVCASLSTDIFWVPRCTKNKNPSAKPVCVCVWITQQQQQQTTFFYIYKSFVQSHNYGFSSPRPFPHHLIIQ